MINMFGLQPQARPVDTFTAPQPVSDEIAKLAQGLSGFGNNLADVATKYGGMTAQALEAEATQYAEIQASKAKNIADFESAIQRGEIKYQDVPWVNTMIRQQIASNMVSKNIIDSMPDFQSKEDQFETSDQVIAYFQAAGANGLDLNDPEVAAVAAPKINETAMKLAGEFVLKRSEKRDKELQSGISDGVVLGIRTGNQADITSLSERYSVLVPREKVISAAMEGFKAAILSDPDLAASEDFEKLVAAFKVKGKDGSMVSILDTAEGLKEFEEAKIRAENLVANRDNIQAAKEDRNEKKLRDQMDRWAADIVNSPDVKGPDGSIDPEKMYQKMQTQFPSAPLSVRETIMGRISNINKTTATAAEKRLYDAVIQLAVNTRAPLNEIMEMPLGDTTIGDEARRLGAFTTVINGYNHADPLNDYTDDQYQIFAGMRDYIDAPWLMANKHRLTDQQFTHATNLIAARAKGIEAPEELTKLLKNSIEMRAAAEGGFGPENKTTAPLVQAALLRFENDYRAIYLNDSIPRDQKPKIVQELLWDTSRRYSGFESQEKYTAAVDSDAAAQQKAREAQIQAAEQLKKLRSAQPGFGVDKLLGKDKLNLDLKTEEGLKTAQTFVGLRELGAETSKEKITFINTLTSEALKGRNPEALLGRAGLLAEQFNSPRWKAAAGEIDEMLADLERGEGNAAQIKEKILGYATGKIATPDERSGFLKTVGTSLFGNLLGKATGDYNLGEAAFESVEDTTTTDVSRVLSEKPATESGFRPILFVRNEQQLKQLAKDYVTKLSFTQQEIDTFIESQRTLLQAQEAMRAYNERNNKSRVPSTSITSYSATGG